MLARLGTGLLVTELMGQGVNAVTGDYSRGAAGFWVESGAVQYPVAEITIAGNLRDMLKDIAAVGDDVDARGGIRVGSILLQGNDHRRRVAAGVARRDLRPQSAAIRILERPVARGSAERGVDFARSPAQRAAAGAARGSGEPSGRSAGAHRLDDRRDQDVLRIAARHENSRILGRDDEPGSLEARDHRRERDAGHVELGDEPPGIPMRAAPARSRARSGT